MTSSLYRNFDREGLDAAYDNRAAVSGYAALAESRKTHSARLRRNLPLHADLRYGATERERLDFFAARGPAAPMLAFIHGGYWQRSDKESHAFLIEGPLARGFSVALVEYTLAPEAKIDQMVSEIERALGWLYEHAAEFGADPKRIYVAGHSAGAHLAAMTLGRSMLAGALLISGLFDLEPIRLGSLNDRLGLSEETAQRFSPLMHLPRSCPPCIVAVGGNELAELRRQSECYASALQAHGLPHRHVVLAGHDHFSILGELEREGGELCTAIAALDAQTVRGM